MSKDNSTSIRGIHVSAGVYQKESVLTYASKNLGITTLGLAGETLKGPAFQVLPISNWREFQETFGGTNTEKFAESQYPKYELPYIAKSYLSESNQLQVCRVLGLSGYEAGPAWVLTAGSQAVRGTDDSSKGMVVAVLRSRGHYEKHYQYTMTPNSDCTCPNNLYDKLVYSVGEILRSTRDCLEPIKYNEYALQIIPYNPLLSTGNDCEDYTYSSTTSSFEISSVNYGRFSIQGMIGPTIGNSYSEVIDKDSDNYFKYSVSLNPNDKEYILNVLGTNPNNGDAPIYVEALYDVALKQGIEEGTISYLHGHQNIEDNNKRSGFEFYQSCKTSEYAQLKPIYSIISKQEEGLQRKDLGKRVVADKASVLEGIQCHRYDYTTNLPYYVSQSGATAIEDENGDLINPWEKTETVEVGQIYTVVQYTDVSGKRHYYYRFYDEGTISGSTIDFVTKLQIKDKLNDNPKAINCFQITAVKNNEDNRYWRVVVNEDDETDKDIKPITCDLFNYKESYRFASTPWIVSNIKGDAKNFELNRLFRFHTISDGTNANNEVKISIANIRPDEGTFDVYVRQWNDTDAMPEIIERFTKCSLKKGSNNYISYRIGSYDGVFESKSKFITVEVNENLATQTSVPCGFMGYPLSQFGGLQISGDTHNDIKQPIIRYNTNYNPDIKEKKQFFGLSDLKGVDIDSFTYKGVAAYGDHYDYLCQGFHLDSRLDLSAYGKDTPTITVDGMTGYTFDSLSTQNRTDMLNEVPVIGTESEMEGSIYESVALRKFTLYFYGGFDGWDIYRQNRTNTDDFKMSKYKGFYSSVTQEGEPFKIISSPELLGLNQQGITSDFYAYLAAIRQFANPEETEINVFATPGIDLINNKLLCEEVIEMIEEERADSIYVATMPDKPYGYSDFEGDMYSADDAVYELEDTEIDSNYTCTYFPWIKYEDTDNSEFIYLPPTKDVVRNMAMTDNVASPWFAPAGLSRGVVDCVRAKKITKIADEDALYEGRINPIKTFARDGVKIWGQKTLQKAENQLNRIHVRRLLLRMRKLIAIACLNLIFEPNDATTKNKFLSLVTPIMDNIKANRGISDYRIEVNDTVESRERRELPAKIFFKPFNSLEYVLLDFVCTPEGLSFDNI